MAIKVHHKYHAGQVLHCASNFTAWDIHGDRWDVGPLTGTIMKKVRRNNRPAYTVELIKGSNPIWPKTIVVTQQMITAGDIEINEPWIPGVPDSPPKEDSPPVVDRSSKAREKEAAEVSVECKWTMDTSVPVKDQMLALVCEELDKLQIQFDKFKMRELELLALKKQVENL